MTYTIPTSSGYGSFFADVNNMVGNNVPAIGTIAMVFLIALFGALSTGKRFEVCLMFAGWMGAITSFFVVVLMHTTAYLAIIPMVIALLSTFIAYATKD